MVQPVDMMILSGRPDCAGIGAAPTMISVRKQEKFSDFFRAGSACLKGLEEEPENQSKQNFGGVRREHQMSIGESLPGGLAPEDEPGLARRSLEPAEWLALVQSAGVEMATAPTVVVSAAPAAPSTLELGAWVERWVRRVALGGDQRRGVARLDIGQGQFAGAELLVVAEAGQVSVQLTLPPEASAPGIAERLRARLERRGLSAEVLVR
jgi:hypothetical protein